MAEDTINERRIPLIQLVKHRGILKHLRSFSDPVEQCNFSTYTGWRGKTYIKDDGHNMPDQPTIYRGVEVMDMYYLTSADYIVLTPGQYADYNMVTGLDIQ